MTKLSVFVRAPLPPSLLLLPLVTLVLSAAIRH
jgi:hypothetical protein